MLLPSFGVLWSTIKLTHGNMESICFINKETQTLSDQRQSLLRSHLSLYLPADHKWDQSKRENNITYHKIPNRRSFVFSNKLIYLRGQRKLLVDTRAELSDCTDNTTLGSCIRSNRLWWLYRHYKATMINKTAPIYTVDNFKVKKLFWFFKICK